MVNRERIVPSTVKEQNRGAQLRKVGEYSIVVRAEESGPEYAKVEKMAQVLN